MAQAIESNAGLGHAWQKMVCLLTGERGIDAKPRSRWIPGMVWKEAKYAIIVLCIAGLPGLEIRDILVANMCYCHKFMVLLI